MPDVDPQYPATAAVVDPAPPIPHAVLTYSGVQPGQRPGILTAIGVVSIVLACLSALICLFAGLETLGFFIITKTAPQMRQTATTFPPSPLTAAQVAAVVTTTQTLIALNPAQTQAIRAALQAPNQQLIAPQYLWSPIRSVRQLTGGTVLIRFNGGNALGGAMLTISPTGQFATTRAGTPGNPFARLKITALTFALAFAEDVASFGMAIFLFIAGILALSDAPQARRWHMRYAMIKIVLTIFGCIATCELIHDLIPGRAGSSGTGSVGFIGALSLLGVIYPMALLLTLSSAEVRRHYSQAS
jgi:hypothetical protein